MKRDPAVTSRIMSAVKARDTTPEQILRKALARSGRRFTAHPKGVFGRPDIALKAIRVAVFVDGDFWHGNSWRVRGFNSLEDQFKKWRRPKWWLAKIRRNMERDREVNKRLRKAGWKVIRVWESAVLKNSSACATRVLRAVGDRNGKRK